jgi:hypothetical protein
MAQVVKLDPGDFLVLANVGPDLMGDIAAVADVLKERLGIGGLIVFSGDVDFSVLPAAQVPDGLAGA